MSIFSKGMPLVIAAIALTVVSWGVYGPVLHKGQLAMNGSRLRPLICVGMAYFVIGVVVPFMLLSRGETGGWTARGILWSSAAGAAGAIGALGIIMAFNFGGSPSYVMPLVFGCAPVVNAFFTIYTQKLWGQISPIFIAGLILVAVGAFTVLFFAPKAAHPPASAKKSSAPAAVTAAAEEAPAEGTS